MKTKTFEIHKDLIIASIIDLMFFSPELRISKKSILENINNSLIRIITNGNIELNPFPMGTYDDLRYKLDCDSETLNDMIDEKYNKLFKN